MPLGASRLAFLSKTAEAAASGRTATEWTANGDVQIDTAQSKFGGSSIAFDGSGDYLTSTDITSLATTDDFTWECWFYMSSLPSTRYTLGESSGYLQIQNVGSGNYDFATALRTSGGTTTYQRWDLVSTATSTWHHVAFVKQGSSWQVYQNGTACNLAATSGTVTSDKGWNNSGSEEYIGRLGTTTTYDMNGWIDEVRLSNTARYTSSFTAPTEPFTNDDNTLYLLHADGTDGSTEFVDDTGTAGFVVGSVSYSGTTDNYSNQSINTTGAASGLKTPSAITVVFLAKPTYNLERLNIMGISDLNNVLRNNIFINTNGTIRFYNALASGTSDRTSTETLTNNDWNLVAISKDVGTGQISGWMNGSSITFPSETITGTTFDFDGSATDIGIGTARAGDHNSYMWNGDVAWVGVWPTYTDFTNSTNQDAVWDSTNSRAIFPGTDGTRYDFGDPIIFHYGNESTVATNQGNIASYTLAEGGSPTDGDHYVATLGEEPAETTSDTSISFAGGDYGYIDAFPNSSTSNSYSFFCWVKFDSSNLSDNSFVFESFRNGISAFRLEKYQSKLMVNGFNSSNSPMYRAQHNSTISAGTWYAVWVSIDPSSTSNRSFCYQQYGSSTVNVVTSSNSAFYANITGSYQSGYYDEAKDIGIFARGANGAVASRGDLAEFWMDDVYRDFTSSTNRQKFVDSSGYPVDLGSDGSTPFGAAPPIYIAGSDMLTNNRGDSGDTPTYVGSPPNGDSVGS